MNTRSVPEFEQTIERLLGETRQKAEADAVTFHYYDSGNDRLILPVGVGLTNPDRWKSWLPSIDRVAGRIVRSREPVFAEDSQHHREATGPFVLAEEIQSSAGFPLVTASEEIVGVLFFNYRAPCSFSAEKRTSLRKIATEVADSVHSQLTPELREQLARHPGLPREQLALQEVTEGVRRALGDVAAAVWGPEREGDSLVVKACAGATGEFVPGVALDLSLSSVVTEAYRTGQRAHAKIEEEPALGEAAGKMGWCEVWAFPVLSHSEVLGVLCLWTIGDHGLAEREKLVIDAFVQLTARTIEYERRIATLNALQGVGARLTFMLTDPQRLMSEIVKSGAQVLGADNTTLHQYDLGTQRFCDVEESVTYHAPGPLQQPREEGGASAYVRDHGYQIIEDMDELDESERQMAWTKHIVEGRVRAYLGIRLRVNEDTLGVLFFNYLRPRTFSPDEIALAEMFAHTASTTIHLSRLFRRADERAQELGALGQVGEELSRGIRLKESQILELVHEQASRVMDTQNMYIALYDAEKNEVSFGLAFEDGERVKVGEGGWAPRRAGKGATEAVIQRKESLLLRTAQEAREWYGRPKHAEYTGAITEKYGYVGVPMLVGERVVGVIAVRSHEADNVYDEYDRAVLSTIASQAAIALDNARLVQGQEDRIAELKAVHSSLKNRVAELEAVYSIVQAIASENDLDALLRRVAEMARDVVKADSATVYRYDREYEEFFQQITLSREKEPMPRPSGTSVAVVNKGEIIFADDAPADAIVGRGPFVPTHVKSCMAAPLQVGDDCVGILYVNFFSSPHQFAPDEERILTIIANQAALATQTVGSLHDIKRRSSTVLRSIEVIKQCETLEALLQAYLTFSLKEVEAESGTIRLPDPLSNELIVRAHSGEAFESEYRAIPRGKGITGRAARDKRTVYCPDIELDGDCPDFFEHSGSELAVPLLVDDDLIGVLSAMHPQKNAFDVYKRRLFEQFASAAAVLIRERIWLDEAYHKHMEAKLEVSAARMTTLMAHHIKNFLGSARMDLDKFVERAQPPLELRKVLTRVDTNMKRCIGISKRLFKPYVTGPKAEASARLLVENSVGCLEAHPDIEIEVSVPNTMPNIHVEVNNTVDFFNELLTNGVRAVRKRLQEGRIDRGRIVVSGHLDKERRVVLHFTNNGPPIPKNQWERIFEQLSGFSMTSIETENFGLGLWGARTFFRRQGGDVFVLGSDESHTTFAVILPSA